VRGARSRTEPRCGRRAWLELAGTAALGWIATRAIGCVADPAPEEAEATSLPLEAGVEAGSEAGAYVILHDTYAQALYLDGTYGPKTGIIRAADIAAGVEKVYDFWHGHGGRLHRFTLGAAHFAALKQKKRVTLATTIVDGHQHTLFVDPNDARWRVPGSPGVVVPV
jgi:hypothetical protein